MSALERLHFDHKDGVVARSYSGNTVLRGIVEIEIEVSDIGLAKASVLAERIKAVIRQEIGVED